MKTSTAPALVLVFASLLPAIQERPPEFARGLELYRNGQLVEAERAFSEALASQPAHAPSSVYLARIYARSGRHGDAETVLKRALVERPNRIGLLNELGSIYLETRRFEDAEAVFTRARASRPDNVRAIGGLAESRLASGHPDQADQAAALIDEAIEARPRVGALHLLGATIELRRERYGRALELLDEAERLGTRGPNVRVVRALALQGSGRLEDALAEIESARKLFPSQVAIERTHGLVLMALNRDAQAASVLAGMVEREPSDATAWAALGQLYFRQSQRDRARLAFERALAAEPGHDQAHFYLGEIALMEVRFEDAVGHYQQAIEKGRGSLAARQKMAEALLKLGRHDDAQACLEEALAVSDEDAQTHYLLGQVLRDAGEPSAALPALVEARRLRPNHAPTRYLLGVTLAQLGRTVEGREELQAFRELKAFEEKAEALELALVEHPEDVVSFRELVELYFAHGREQDALPFLEKAVALSADDADLWYRLALARARDGRARDAQAAAERATALDPEHPLRLKVEEALERSRKKDD
jgi:tetratricopeptide (TPR) repeat protein